MADLPSLQQRTFEFVESIKSCADVEAIASALSKEMADLGFEYVTCFTMPAPGQPMIDGLIFNSRPQEYVRRYIEENTLLRDPVIKHLRKEARPYSWSDVKERDALTKADVRVFDEATDFRMEDGLIVPFITPSGTVALFSPCGEKPDLSPEARTAAEMMGVMALQAFRRAIQDGMREEGPYKPLTPREREILQWVASGKSDDEISQILSISVTTVIKHVENAKRKLDSYKRTAAIITALRRGEIHL